MSRFALPLILCAVLAAPVALADDLLPTPPGQSPAQAPAQAPMQSSPGQGAQQQDIADARAACNADVQNLCPSVQPGGGRILACLKQHKDQVSQGCKQAVAKAMKAAN